MRRGFFRWFGRSWSAICVFGVLIQVSLLAEDGSVTRDWGLLEWSEDGIVLNVARVPENRRLSLPRFRNSFGGMTVDGAPAESWARIVPEVVYWEARLGDDAPEAPFELKIETVGAPRLALQPVIARPKESGELWLPAAHCDVHGEMLRFEPQPYKNTIGYWVRVADWASWFCTVPEAGAYEVWVHQGCGKNQGGSLVEFRVGDTRLSYTVKETGHFQNFERRLVGVADLPAGKVIPIEVRPSKIAANAVMDIRLIELVPSRP